MPLLGLEGLVERATEDFGVAALRLVLRLDIACGLFNHGERQFIAGLIIIVPRDEAVLTHHDGLDGRVLAGDILHGQAKFETRTHPLHIGHLAGENLLGEGLAVLGGGDGNDRVRVHVVDVLAGQEAVERGVNRRGPRVEVEGGVIIHRDHVVLGLGFQTLISAGSVGLLEAHQLVLIKRGEVLAIAGPKVAARTFNPEYGRVGASQGILLHNFRRGIAPAGVRDALISAEFIGAIDEAPDGVELGRFGIVPEVRDVLVLGHVGDVEKG